MKGIQSLALVVCLIVAGAAININPNYTYKDFCEFTKCQYKGEEYEAHEKIFLKNYATLLADIADGKDRKVTKFLDWNETQKKTFMNHKEVIEGEIPIDISGGLIVGSIPSSFDWRDSGKVSPIKQQLTCGSCWSFAATGIYESQILIHQNKEYDLAEQYALECETQSFGCQGGYIKQPLQLFASSGGIPLESKYPYKNTNSTSTPGICTDDDRIKLNRKVDGVVLQTYQSDDKIAEYLIKYGPLGVSVYSDNSAFMNAGSSGIIDDCPYSSSTDHAVILVGYTSTHWIIKNSWGTQWGKDGFGYIKKTNNCLLNKYIRIMMVDEEPIVPEQVQLEFTIEMTDSYGDGWNSNILAFKADNVVLAVFGDNFTSGSSAVQTVKFNWTNSYTQIVVNQLAKWTSEIGFTVKDANGNIVHTHESGNDFVASTVFHGWCPNCVETEATYTVKLTDSYGDGWNANILSFDIDGEKTSFGANFTNGHNLDPFDINFTISSTVSITVKVLAQWSQEIGFEVRNKYGQIVFSRSSGTAFQANEILGSFCVECDNLSPIRDLVKEDKQEDKPEPKPEDDTTVIQSTSNNATVIALSVVLGIVSMLLIAITAYACILRNKLKSNQSANVRDPFSPVKLNESKKGDVELS